MSRILISRETDPYYNVAAEHELFLQGREGTRLFLWQNRPAVVLGRSQNFSAECDMDFLKRKGILPVRRFSGGGAVFHDLGNLNFTFLDREEAAQPDRYLKVVRTAMGKLGLECEHSGRNDLMLGGKKFSGQAYYADEGCYLYHGTILVDVDLALLSGALRPSFLKLSSKGIASVRSRVTNLKEADSTITVERVKEALGRAFAEEFGLEGERASFLDRQSLRPGGAELLRRDEWLYGETPDFSVRIEKKLSFGNATLLAQVSDGKILHLKIHTDSLENLDFSACEREMEGEFFQEENIAEKLEKWYNLLDGKGAAARFMPHSRS